MTLPFDLPAWVPAWVQLLIVVAGVLIAGAYLLMPFSVFGLKARMEALDQRLEDLQSDVRELSHRLPDQEMRRPAALGPPAPSRRPGAPGRSPRPVATAADPAGAHGSRTRSDAHPLRTPAPPASRAMTAYPAPMLRSASVSGP